MMDTAIFSFLAAAVITISIIPLVQRFALRFQLTDNPSRDNLKIHTHPIPFVGGIAMFAGLFGATVLTKGISLWIAIFLGIATLFGAIDDLCWQERTHRNLALKIIFQLLLAWIFVGIVYGIMYLPFTPHPLFLGFLFLLFVNAANMQDGLDGLLGGIACISALGFLAYFLTTGTSGDGVILGAVLLGISLGFLVFNFPPARLFMGDNGSYLIGAFFTFLFILVIGEQGPTAILPALLIIGLPLFNTCFVILRRLIKGTSPLVGDRYHLYDMIQQRVSDPILAIVINYALHAILVAAGTAILL